MEKILQYTPLISALMPLIIVIITGCWINGRIEKIKNRLQLDHSIIKKRADTYAEIQDDINKIYSYIMRVGKWKDLTPQDILIAKRNSDQKFHTTQPYWSTQTFESYHALMKVCFKTYRGHRMDAGIIADVDKYKQLLSWNDEYVDCFVDGYNQQSLKEIYMIFIQSLSKDFGII